MCDINTIGFVSLYACRVCDVLVATYATFHLVTPLSMNQSGRPTLNEGMTLALLDLKVAIRERYLAESMLLQSR